MENDRTVKTKKKYFYLCLLLVLTVLLINLLSAYIRHSEAGLDCKTWPQCYGLIGQFAVPESTAVVAEMALTPTQTAKRLHRSIATGLVVLVFMVVYQARQRLPGSGITGMVQYVPYLLILVILILSVIGPASYLKTLPAIATLNLMGGVALLTLSWWLWLEIQHPRKVAASKSLRRLVCAALCMVILQLALGAWTSANFAGAACGQLLSCGGYERTPATIWESFWYFRELTVDERGRVIIDQSQRFIHLGHRLGAVVSAALLIVLGIRSLALPGPVARWGFCVLVLLAVQLLLGVVVILAGLPLMVVLGHNLVASLLLLSVVRISLLTLNSASGPGARRRVVDVEAVT